MLFYNCSDLNFNLDLSGQLRRDLFKDPSKIISKSLESDDSSLESDPYICDLSIDEEIDVGFFDQLKTPSDEVKPFPSLEEAPSLAFGNLSRDPIDFKVPINKRAKSLAIIIDEDMEQERADRSRQQREQSSTSHETADTSEPLTTPVVDPNSTLATTGPVFPLAHMDALSNYFIPDLPRFQPHPESLHNSSAIVVSSSLPLTTGSPSSSTSLAPSSTIHTRNESDEIRISAQSYSMVATSSSSPLHHPQASLAVASSSASFNNLVSHDFFSSPMVLNEASRPPTASSGYLTATPSSFPNPDPSYSPSMTPPSAAPSYHELTPPSASRSFSSLVPTVIKDHPYHTRGTSASPMTPLGLSLSHGQTSMSSTPSPCPSTSSMANCSTVDCKESTQDLLSFYGHDSVSNHEVSKTSVNESFSSSSSRKGRLTKKEKLDKMVYEERRLANENSQLKKQVDTISRDVKNLKEQLIMILRNPRKRSHGGEDEDAKSGAS